MIGGMNMPPMEAAGSMAPATWGRKPAFFIIGMVNAPVETVLAIAEPETEPKKPEAMTATLAGPPTLLPARASGRSMKNLLAPEAFRKDAEEDEQDHVGDQHVGHDAEHAVLVVDTGS